MESRRTFLKKLGLTGGLMAASGVSLYRCGRVENAFMAGFVDPPSEMRPFYRWWWNGNRVTADEIRRELRLMQQQGAGGVEVNPIALAEEHYDDIPGKAIEWLSDEWLNMVRVTVDESKKLDMTVDLMVGTGWPFGGKFLSPDETIQGVELEVIRVSGGKTFTTTFNIPGDDNHKLMQAVMVPVPLKSLDDMVDVTDKVDENNRLQVKLPAGQYELHVVTWRNRFRDVLFGAPGADGPVLDHFNKTAVKKYLDRMSDALKTVLGNDLGKHIRSMFCDSIELEGANWTGDMAEQFEKRRGYALAPWLALVLDQKVQAEGKVADDIRRARYDMSLTLSELFMERFIETFHNWCHENNVQSRYQAYGHPWLYTDLLDGYLVPDIPESDQWLFNRGWVPDAAIDDIRYAIWNKYTSSGAHLAGRNVISCEAMTNSKGVFRASLEYIKQATDLDTVCGINHLVLHGFNYSPPEAGFPGWIRFGTYFNEHNTWWPYAKHWFDYAARLAYVFQNSQPVSQIAILGNTPDKWSDYGLDRNPWNMNPPYLHQLWQALNHYGYTSDYVNNTILLNAVFDRGELVFRNMRYQQLIVTDVQTLWPETMDALKRYAEAGGCIVFVGELPSRTPSMQSKETDYASIINDLLKTFPHIKHVDAPPNGSIMPWMPQLLKNLRAVPGVRFTTIDERLFYIQHVQDGRDIYFISNQDRDKSLSFEAEFPVKGKYPWRWDAETGGRNLYTQTGQGGGVLIDLAPLESILLVFELAEQSKEGSEWQQVRPTAGGFELKSPWQVELNYVDGRKKSLSLNTLQDLAELPEAVDFSGTAVYSTEFRASFSGQMVLDLGQVYETAEVELNGQPLGLKWWGEKQYLIEDLPANTKHVLKIKVTNLLFNYARSLKDNKAAQHWVERSGLDGPIASGLLGPVKLHRIDQRDPADDVMV